MLGQNILKSLRLGRWGTHLRYVDEHMCEHRFKNTSYLAISKKTCLHKDFALFHIQICPSKLARILKDTLFFLKINIFRSLNAKRTIHVLLKKRKKEKKERKKKKEKKKKEKKKDHSSNVFCSCLCIPIYLRAPP